MLQRLPKYRSAREEVGAVRITMIEVKRWENLVVLDVMDGEVARRRMSVTYDTYFLDKPGLGWYLVQSAKGEIRFVPPVPFELRFAPVEAPAREVAAR